MKDVTALGVKFTVVAAKVEGEFIVRGIKKWTTPEALRVKLEPYVAVFDPEAVEWTFHDYFLPHYLQYGSGDIPRLAAATDGIYLHRHIDHDSYGDGRKLVSL